MAPDWAALRLSISGRKVPLQIGPQQTCYYYY